MKKLSSKTSNLKTHYDAIVVGSGYGAGIAASRLARMGLEVCVLERGPERVLGDFPATLAQASDEFQIDMPYKHFGSKNALFDMRTNSDISVLVGCGLGGTSLINGNVMLKPDQRVFDNTDWPKEIRADLDTKLAEGYARANRMLQPVPYPDKVKLKKLEAFKTAANAIGGQCTLPPITVTFDTNNSANYANVMQENCTLCGDCCSGCNIGAKNTTALNYIPDAVNHGAEIYTLMEVQHVEKAKTVWRVHYSHDNKTVASITANTVVLGAGTLGSSEILMRSQAKGLSLSSTLGNGFSGNADVIAFGYNNDIPINGVGTGNPLPTETDPVGPVIAGLIDLRDTTDVYDGMVIQEGAIPSPLASILPALSLVLSASFGDDTDSGWNDFWAETKRSWGSVFQGAYTGATYHTQTLLVMAHDASDGKMHLQDNRLRINWPSAGKHPVFQKIDETLYDMTAATGGTFINNPMWSKALGRSLVSVHPLGGCCFGETNTTGVVNHKCQVYKNKKGVHKGLYVMDGSVMPSSLGVNPSFSISAIAERAMMYFAEDHQLTFDDKQKQNAPLRYAITQ